MGLFGIGKKKTEKHDHDHDHDHEHDHGHEHAAAGSPKVKDLVCGMLIDPKTAAARSDYMGKTYYFCAPGCKKAFDADPAKYVKA